MGVANDVVIAITSAAGGLLANTIWDSVSKTAGRRAIRQSYVSHMRASAAQVEKLNKTLSAIDVEKLTRLVQTEQERVAAQKVVEDYLAHIEDVGELKP